MRYEEMTDRAAILIVDHRPATAMALEGLLSSDDRVVISARSASEALEIVSRERIDLILLDMQMPEMNGFELARILRSREETARIPILFASAEKLDYGSGMKGFGEGIIDYLFKPVDPEVTKAKVKVLLEVQRQKKELMEKNTLLERSALLISNSADIIGIVDADSLVIDEMNPAFTAILGYDKTAYRGKVVTSFMDAANGRILERLAGSGSEKLSFETGIICRDGSTRQLDWHVSIRNGKWFVNARDVTETKQLNARLQSNILHLEAANSELESFSYSVSHDLRAPLRALNGNAMILEEDFGDMLDEGAKKVLKKIQYNAIRMNTMINDLLSLSRLGRKELRKTGVNMDALVGEVLAEVGQGGTHQARIELHSLPECRGDYDMLRQVWTNLLSNAIKYSAKKENPVVEIGSNLRHGEMEYYVKDNGAGFDMNYAAKVFGIFQRLHDVTEFEGTGIGLAIVQKIIHRHGGTIRAESAPKEGATFWFTLPG